MDAIYFASAAAFGAWLDEHHAHRSEVLVGFWKAGTGKPSMTWPESVDEALCFGWIDGVRRRVDDERYTIRFTPRKPGSNWSAINLAKVEALRAAGRMRPAGEAALGAAPPSARPSTPSSRPSRRAWTPSRRRRSGPTRARGRGSRRRRRPTGVRRRTG